MDFLIALNPDFYLTLLAAVSGDRLDRQIHISIGEREPQSESPIGEKLNGLARDRDRGGGLGSAVEDDFTVGREPKISGA